MTYQTVSLYDSIAKARKLGLTIDGTLIPKLHINRMYTIDAAIEKVRLAKLEAKRGR